ncbi:MAG: LysR substrate-binding domain-containing protein [Mycobacterium sp.]
MEAARQGLSASTEPAGTLRVGGFTAGIRVSLLPILHELAASTSAVEAVVNEYAPDQSLKLLLEDQIDLALTYDFGLSPATLPASLECTPIWTTVWGLGVPGQGLEGQADLCAFADQAWIVNSGSAADENVVRVLASIFGFTPKIVHRIETLELADDFVRAGHGVALLPMARPTRDGVRMLAIKDPEVTFTAYAVWRKGRGGWSPLRVVLDRLLPAQGLVPRLSHWPRSA